MQSHIRRSLTGYVFKLFYVAFHKNFLLVNIVIQNMSRFWGSCSYIIKKEI